jgi:hypothetical protein
VWREAAARWRDFRALGIAGLPDAVLSSVGAGARQPHRDIFGNRLPCGQPARHRTGTCLTRPCSGNGYIV